MLVFCNIANSPYLGQINSWRRCFLQSFNNEPGKSLQSIIWFIAIMGLCLRRPNYIRIRDYNNFVLSYFGSDEPQLRFVSLDLNLADSGAAESLLRLAFCK